MTRRKLGLEASLSEFQENPLYKAAKDLPLVEQIAVMAAQYRDEVHANRDLRDASLYGKSSLSNFIFDYFQGKAQIFKIAERFGHHLNRTNVDLPSDLIPYVQNKCFWFEFPESLVFECGGFYYQEVIAHMGKNYQGDNVLFLMFRDYTKQGQPLGQFTNIVFSLIPGENISVALDRVNKTTLPGYTTLATDMPWHAVEYVLKCLLYVHSGEPDIHPERGNPPLTEKPKKYRRHIEEFCPFSVCHVGYSFHERLRHVDEAAVSGHFRWQPYGPMRSQVKLIWIDEHIRRYKDPVEESLSPQ